MHPIDTQDKLFHDGDGVSELGTILPAWWLNQVQAELLGVLTAAGISPNRGNSGQLLQALRKLYPAASAQQAGVAKLIDNLTAGGTDAALTAEQGKLLKQMIDTASASAVPYTGATKHVDLNGKNITNAGEVKLGDGRNNGYQQIVMGNYERAHGKGNYGGVLNGQFAGGSVRWMSLSNFGEDGNHISSLWADATKAYVRLGNTNHELATKGNTLAHYGITDAATKAELRNIVRNNYNRSITLPNSGSRAVEVVGDSAVYPDGRVVQIYHLKNISLAWLPYEDAATGQHKSEWRARQLTLQLWTAMPHKVTEVRTQIVRNTDRANSQTYAAEAAEWECAWSLTKQGTAKNQVVVDISRKTGGSDEPVDLYIVVEGY